MRELTLEERKHFALLVLERIHYLCQKLSLNYSITAGTMLGAVRHKGFIPWDDDIDILMSRADFEKLKSYLITNPDPICHWISYDTDNRYGYFFAKIVHNDTYLVDPLCNYKNAPLGVAVDVFPVDQLGETYKEAASKHKRVKIWTFLLIATNWGKYFRSFSRPWFIEPIRLFLFIISRFLKPHWLIARINTICEVQQKKEKQFWGMIMFGKNGCIYNSEVYQKFQDIEFEGKKFKVLKAYHEMLTDLYGNYMELPPEEKRVSHHYGHYYRK